jgi:MFS family permease
MRVTNAIKASLLLASTMTIMAGAIVAPSLPRISDAFAHMAHIDLLSRLVLTLPALFITLFSSLAGWSIDKFGRRVMLLGSLLLYALAGTTGAYINDLYLILVGRALLGIAVAGNMIAINTLIGDLMQGDERSRFFGFQGSFMAFGGVFFILLAGWLADISWELPFWIYSLSLVVLALCYVFVPEPVRITTNKPLARSSTNSYKPATAYFIMFMGFTGMTLFYIIPVQIPFLLAGFENVSNSQIGYAISLSTLMGALISFFYGRIKQKLSFQWIYALTFLLFSLGFMVISNAGSYSTTLFGLALAGSGAGLLFPNANLWMVHIAPENKRGQLLGHMNMAVFMGQFVSPLMVHPLIQNKGIQAVFFYPGLLMLLIAALFAVHQIGGPRK